MLLLSLVMHTTFLFSKRNVCEVVSMGSLGATMLIKDIVFPKPQKFLPHDCVVKVSYMYKVKYKKTFRCLA